MSAKPSHAPLHLSIFSQVYLIDGKIVRKFPEESSYPDDPTIAILNEKVAYEHIGNHPRIAQWIPSDTDDYIDLEYYPNGNILDYLNNYRDEIAPDLVARWGSQIIESIAVIHAKDIIHSDLNLKQVLLDDNLNARLSDFNASACLGQPALGYEKATHCLPRDQQDPNTVQSDLFALGSTLYELAHGKGPYSELYPQPDTSIQPEDAQISYYKLREQADQKVEHLFSQKIFPDVSGSFCGCTIRGCWEERFTSAEEVLSSYKDEITKSGLGGDDHI
ncbi:serine/threonine protein kinase [Capronia epimyces CBS 606.96]|uniref:Serine/threonine protein kinase n=1 Tax=Capronia epimyces CBS 606.96 TaxID=1182542 RepID=W9Y386_9EURO|nr:serine/threonine protein kinase [Capronia epimyces CBS 606.96]EXJ76904.1 serine/threonine protein kinase [Capronia epimyces CBS 606.96]